MSKPNRLSLLLSLGIFLVSGATVRSEDKAIDPKEKAPVYKTLKVLPSKMTLTSIRDSRRVIVAGIAKDGKEYDVTSQVKLTSSSSSISIDKYGYIFPLQKGKGEVTVTLGELKVILPVEVKDTNSLPVDFTKEIVPVMSKVGCNAGTCHGAQKGEGGFKLSLRGYDPLFDYRALIDDLSGRRFNRSQPNQSLMLLKPTQGVPHEGGFLFEEDSRYYKLIEQWISEGCRYEKTDRVKRIEILPSKPLLQAAENEQQLIVIAHFADGSSRDVTREAIFESNNFEVATVNSSGLIEGVRRGESAALVRYEGTYAAAPITVIGEREGFVWRETPEIGQIDKLVNVKLKRLKILPSELSSDAEFLRRLSLDLRGISPTLEETKKFLADKRHNRTKREQKIEEYLSSAEFIDHWTLKWSDLLMSNRKYIKEKGVWGFRNWIRQAVATNLPYDKFAYQLVTASGSTLENPAANYYRIAREPKVVMENMTQVFLGTRFQCNQCHDHPFEKWTQQQYYELSVYFSGVGRKKGISADEEIIYSMRNPKPVAHPGTGENMNAKFPFVHDSMPGGKENLRKQVARWLTAKENPYFAMSLVNRYWSYFLGRGIIDPVDDIRASNPPSNPELLDYLTKDFLASNFDLKHLIRSIVSTHTYQRSLKSNRWNDTDDRNYSHAMPRRLSAEQLYDSIITATGAPRRLPGVPAGFRASQLPDPNYKVAFLDMFGRPPRESPCECERTSDVSLSQTLNLVNGATVADSIAHADGLIKKLIAQKATSEETVEAIYLSVFCRYPSKAEKKNAIDYFAKVKKRSEAAEDLMWALINSPAFLFNR